MVFGVFVKISMEFCARDTHTQHTHTDTERNISMIKHVGVTHKIKESSGGRAALLKTDA